jgi:hypothetical protein
MQLQTLQQNAFSVSVVRIKKMQNELPQTIHLLFISENRKRNKKKQNETKDLFLFVKYFDPRYLRKCS